MGRPHPPEPVLVFAGILAAPGTDAEGLEAALAGTFGAVMARGPCFPFTDSRYYDGEMGPGLSRWWLAFSPLREDGCLPRLKSEGNALEDRFAAGGRRTVNVDPGTLDAHRVVLASTKGSAHRIYLGGGIWGDLHFRAEGKGFAPLPWTYRDYRRPEVLSWFSELRERYLGLVRSGSGGDA